MELDALVMVHILTHREENHCIYVLDRERGREGAGIANGESGMWFSVVYECACTFCLWPCVCESECECDYPFS